MITYRSAALALVTCAAILSVTACTAGITTASQGASAAAPSPGPVPAASTVAISGPLGSFPVPSGAKVAENVGAGQAVIILFSGIAPAQVSAFYATALPRAGFTVTGNSLITESGVNGAVIQFSGRGYQGNIAAMANFDNPGTGLAGLGNKNVTTIELT